MTPDTAFDALSRALTEEIPAAVQLRHELHARPEVSGSETWTAARVAAALDEPDAAAVAGTGRLVRLGPPDGPSIAVRAELDALPVRERTDAPFSATGPAMHACGHDVHLAALVALCRAARRVGLPTGLLAVLQPREETHPSGAQDITASTALAEHDVRAVVGVHVQPQLPLGTVAADPGVVNAGSDEFTLTVTGAGGHGGYPHLARDPVPALCACVNVLQQVLRGSVRPVQPAALSVGVLEAGQAANVIPDTARARGTLRTFSDADRKRLLDRLRAAAVGVAAAHDCRATFDVDPIEPPLVNDPQLAMRTAEWLTRSGFAVGEIFRSCGSDDFAHYSTVAPSIMVFLGVGGEGVPMLHEPRFLPDDGRVYDVARAALAGYRAAVAYDAES